MEGRAILLAVAVASVGLRAEVLPIKSYTTADGLASDRIYKIVADSRGFLWFCTPEGLSRFDGYRFVNYGTDQGLPNRTVYTIRETRSGDFLIGTGGGLAKITSGARFSTYAVSQEPAKNAVIAIQEGIAGRVLLASPREVFEWTGPRSFSAKPQRPGPILIQDLLVERHGDVFVPTSNDLSIYNATGLVQRFTREDGLPGQWVETMLLDRKGRVWVALRGGLALLVRDSDGKWRLTNTYTERSGLVSNVVGALAEASDGTLWIATEGGISRMKTTASGEPVFNNLTRAQGLTDRAITALAEDQAGNMWAGTEGAGVMRFDRLGFTTYREQDGLGSDRVYSVFENRAGQLAAVTSGTGTAIRSVSVLDGNRFHTVPSGIYATRASWGWNQVFLQSHKGDWWGATNQGLCRFGAKQTCYSDGTIFRIFEDSRGGIWASGQSDPVELGDRLMRWDPEKETLINVQAPRIPGEHFARGYPDDIASAFAEDAQGNIWMGLYRGGGLYRYDGREFRVFQASDGVPAGTIFALFADKTGVWVGADGGLARVEDAGSQHPRIRTYTTAQGLSSNTIYCLTEDDQGRIYAGTGKGLDRLDPVTGSVRHFTTADGLAHGEFTSAFRDRSGSLWFGTKQGLSKLNPAADPLPVKPRILITDLRVGGNTYPVSQLGESRVSHLELKPAQNQIQVEFTGLDYEPGDVVRYSFKLDGAGKQWSAPSMQRSVDYAALGSGTYRFLVKAVTSEGGESVEPAEIDFTVLPPFWQRWWFMGAAVVLIAGLILMAHRYRVAQMVKMERMRTAIATDLHDDIGSSLSQIAILSEVARAGGTAHGAEPLEKIAGLARELVDSMGDIVWSIRSDRNEVVSLVRRMREFALDVLGPQGIRFELDAASAEQVHLSLQMRRQLFLIFKECIRNVERHARASSVTAELDLAGNQLILAIVDDGVGLNANVAPRETGGMGIPNMRCRAASLGGSLVLRTEPEKGCRVEIRVPAHSRGWHAG